MEEIGTHCVECNRLDFLPFTCQVCKKSYCSNHRQMFNEHQCVNLKVQKRDTSHLPPSSSLFPERPAVPKPRAVNNSILSKLETKSANEDSLAQSALIKLKHFLKKNKSSKKKTSNATSRLIELANLKKQAIGDVKVPQTERVYINVRYVPSLLEAGKKDQSLAIYVSRSWPIGRMLDQAAVHLKIVNENNKTQDPEKKLTIFRSPRSAEKVVDPIYIPANGRVMKEIENGDTVFLVRGASVAA